MHQIQLNNVSKTYTVGAESVEALKNITLSIRKGEFLTIVGPSGSGKSTLLHLIGGLDAPTEGEIIVDGTELTLLNDRQLSKYRNADIGFIFQDFHLQPYLTATENVEIPLMFATSRKRKIATIEKKAKQLMAAVGLSSRLQHRPSEISGGQKQRVAIARALIGSPKILLADEPTGNLDSVTGKKIIQLLKKVHKDKKITVIVVTHDHEIAKYADRIVEIKDGALITKNRFRKFTSVSYR